jgi:hypothetical protein
MEQLFAGFIFGVLTSLRILLLRPSRCCYGGFNGSFSLGDYAMENPSPNCERENQITADEAAIETWLNEGGALGPDD